MSEKDERAEIRRIVHETLNLYHHDEISEEELQEILAYALMLELSAPLNQSLADAEQKLRKQLEQYTGRFAPSNMLEYAGEF